MEYEILTRSLKDSAAHSKLKLLKEGETFGVEKPGGEKRIHIGSMTDENKWDRFFFPNGGQSFNVIVSKIDLIKYMFEAKDEYFNPKQSYRLKISDYYDSLYEQTMNIPLESFKICFEKNTDNSRYYLSRPSNNEFSKNYKYIIDICLPIVTKYVFIRVKDDNSYIFYLKPEFRPNYITNEKNTPDVTEKNSDSQYQSLQQIFYGAPGTGKSNTTKRDTEVAEKEGRVFRTTFHPDSDYSTFVGCYKPSMKSSEKVYTQEELIAKLEEIKNTGTTYPCHKFSAKYWRSLKDLSTENTKKILSACGFTDSMTTEILKGVSIGQEYLNDAEDGTIVYTFTPQAFTNAYVKAWNTTEDVYLIIEEINRGNCAQIFGDLFQLLDRKDGVSEYPIDADTDLRNYLSTELAKSTRDDFPEGVKEGKKLVLPKNLYIWATMNTSDQSLFPIDSAFKRRWDWKYIPIKNHEEKDFKIDINGTIYSWWGFLEKINKVIGKVTSSEDKKLGYFFVKANGKDIDATKFVGKVLFYLWNDVFKNYGFDNTIFSRAENKKFEFSDFFDKNGEPETTVVNEFLKKLDETIDKDNSFIIKKSNDTVSSEEESSDEDNEQQEG